MRHIYADVRPGTSRLTMRWELRSQAGAHLLGEVRWHAPWRRYCFYPAGGTLFEQDCLRDIAEFIEVKTQLHRDTRKMEREIG